MPKVPTYDGNHVQVEPVGVVMGRPAGADAYGAGLADDLLASGRIGAAMIAHEQEKNDTAAANGAKAEIMGESARLMAKASTVQGAGVMSGYDEAGNKKPGAPSLTEHYMQEYGQRVQEITKRLTPSQMELFKPYALSHTVGFEKGLLSHEISQREQWREDQTKSLLATQVNRWESAPEQGAEQERKDALATLSELYSGETLALKTRELETAVAYSRVASRIRSNPADGRMYLDTVDKNTLGDEQRSKLLDMAYRREHQIAGEKQDELFQTVLLPALESKSYVRDVTSTSAYQVIKALNPETAASLLKHSQSYNADLAVDRFDEWMTGLGSGARENLTFSRVPEQIRRDLKEFSPKAYNTLASRFDEERAIRGARSASREGNRDDWAMLNLTAMTRPDLIDDNQIMNGIMSGEIKPQQGMALLSKLQKSRDVGGALRSRESGVGALINAEADSLVEGIKGADKRRIAKKRIVGTIHDVLEDVFHSRSEVTPEVVKGALERMRRATVTRKGEWYSYDRQVPALSVDPDDEVITERKYRESSEYYRRQRGLTPAQAAARFSLWRSLGKNTFPLIPETRK